MKGAIINPFLYITPRKKEKIVNDSFVRKVISEIKKRKNGIIFITGGYGAGKTQYLLEIQNRLKKLRKKVDFIAFSPKIFDEIKKSVKKNNIILIDSIDLVLSLKNQNEILNLIREYSDKKLFVITLLPESLKKIGRIRKDAKIFEIPKLSFKEAKELIESRLKEVKMKLHEVFSEEELKYIWKKANGNARIILMIAQSIFDSKMRK